MLAQRNLRLGRVLALLLIALPLLAVFAPNVPRPAIFAQESAPPSGNVIVVLKRNGKELPAQAAGKARVHARHVYSHVISGFSTTLTAAEAQTLANDTNVARIYPEEQFQAAAQSLPTGLQRIGADQNTAVDVDEIDDVRVHTDVAVLDSGISDATGDLNLSGGVNCSTSTSDYNDDVYGHGTHVAGTIGAFDNNRGVVGVRTDEFARVLRTDDSTVKGLYAVGNTSAAVMGRSYAGAGATIGPAMTFGYVAAKHIEDQLPKPVAVKPIRHSIRIER